MWELFSDVMHVTYDEMPAGDILIGHVLPNPTVFALHSAHTQRTLFIVAASNESVLLIKWGTHGVKSISQK